MFYIMYHILKKYNYFFLVYFIALLPFLQDASISVAAISHIYQVLNLPF